MPSICVFATGLWATWGGRVNRRGFLGLIGAWAVCQVMVETAFGAPENGRAEVADEIVAFNTRSKKYHCRKCRTIRSCTNCIDMALSKARERGVACKVCRGSCG